MKNIKKFKKFSESNNFVNNDKLADLLIRANELLAEYNDDVPDSEVLSPIDILVQLSEVDMTSELFEESQLLYNEIKSLLDQIEPLNNIVENFQNESVGEYEVNFVDVNIDETELEDSDRPNLGKLKQKAGKVIIETPSKTDAYNAKMRLGGDVVQEPGFSDKQIHYVKSLKTFDKF